MPTACTACGHPLSDPASVAIGYGPECAVRVGAVPPKPPRAPSAARLARERQLELPWLGDVARELADLGVAPAAWPAVLRARATARERGWLGAPGCDDCAIFGACALHSPAPTGVDSARRPCFFCDEPTGAGVVWRSPRAAACAGCVAHLRAWLGGRR